MLNRTEEYLVGTSLGVLKVRSIRRHGMKELQWDKKKLDEMKGVPWAPTPGRDGVEVRSYVMIPERQDEPRRIPEPEDKEVVRRRAGIKKEDVMEFGGTPGCQGCLAANRGMRRNHNDTCRKRMEGFMAKYGDARIDRCAKRVA